MLGLNVLFTVFRMTFLSTNRVYCIDEARQELGYEPIVSMEEGLTRTVAWLKQLDAKECDIVDVKER